MTVTPTRKFKLAPASPEEIEKLKTQNRFLELYLQIRDEIVDGNFYQKPDPVMVLVYYLRRYSEIREPRGIHRLLEVSLDRVLDRLSKLGFMELPSKEYSIFRPSVQKKIVEVEDIDEVPPEPIIPVSAPEPEQSDEDKLSQFMLKV